MSCWIAISATNYEGTLSPPQKSNAVLYSPQFQLQVLLLRHANCWSEREYGIFLAGFIDRLLMLLKLRGSFFLICVLLSRPASGWVGLENFSASENKISALILNIVGFSVILSLGTIYSELEGVRLSQQLFTGNFSGLCQVFTKTASQAPPFMIPPPEKILLVPFKIFKKNPTTALCGSIIKQFFMASHSH